MGKTADGRRWEKQSRGSGGAARRGRLSAGGSARGPPDRGGWWKRPAGWAAVGRLGRWAGAGEGKTAHERRRRGGKMG